MARGCARWPFEENVALAVEIGQVLGVQRAPDSTVEEYLRELRAHLDLPEEEPGTRRATRTKTAIIAAMTRIDAMPVSTNQDATASGSGIGSPSPAAIGMAIKIPISASPAMSPDPNSTPWSRAALRAARRLSRKKRSNPPARMGTSSEKGR